MWLCVCVGVSEKGKQAHKANNHERATSRSAAARGARDDVFACFLWLVTHAIHKATKYTTCTRTQAPPSLCLQAWWLSSLSTGAPRWASQASHPPTIIIASQPLPHDTTTHYTGNPPPPRTRRRNHGHVLGARRHPQERRGQEHGAGTTSPFVSVCCALPSPQSILAAHAQHPLTTPNIVVPRLPPGRRPYCQQGKHAILCVPPVHL